MKPHPKLRKAIKWGGLAVTVLLVVVWASSGWWTLWWYESSGFGVAVNKGAFRAMQNDKQAATLTGLNFKFLPLDFSLTWRYTYIKSFRPKFLLLELPLWPVPLACAVVTALGWFSDAASRRRARLNLCPKCNYDRTGLAMGAKCPECGAVPASIDAASARS